MGGKVSSAPPPETAVFDFSISTTTVGSKVSSAPPVAPSVVSTPPAVFDFSISTTTVGSKVSSAPPPPVDPSPPVVEVGTAGGVCSGSTETTVGWVSSASPTPSCVAGSISLVLTPFSSNPAAPPSTPAKGSTSVTAFWRSSNVWGSTPARGSTLSTETSCTDVFLRISISSGVNSIL